MRRASTPTLLLLAGAVAVAVSWGAWQRERASERSRPVASARCDEHIEQSNRAADSVPNARLNALREHRDECQGSAGYLEQLLREMLQQQQIDSARELLSSARQQRVLVPAEHDALTGWIELAESQQAFSDGRVSDADRLRDSVIARATRLRTAWPEWSTPYFLLTEADRSSVTPPGADRSDRIAQLRRARTAVRSGAFVRNMVAPLYVVYVALVTLFGFAGVLLATRHWLDRRARTALPPTPIGTLTAGEWNDRDVAVHGVLHPLPGRGLLTAPFSKEPALWYKHVINFSSRFRKRGSTSEERFLVADETGQLIIDPVGFRVLTTHTKITLGGVIGTKRTKPTLEDRLEDGDTVYGHGRLARDASRSDVAVLAVDRNERHLLSNIAPATLRARARKVFLCGIALAVASVAVVCWSERQRRQEGRPEQRLESRVT